MDNEFAKYPTEFRGCTWDDGWEFDAPCVLYSPIKRYGIGNNSGYLENMVEDYCIDLALGDTPRRGLTASEKKEFAWRGWSERGMRHRKRAWHRVITVRWYRDSYGELCFEPKTVYEGYGPPPAAADGAGAGDGEGA